MKNKLIVSILVFSLLAGYQALAQISPGDLAQVHASLEGISNCTKCHTLGAKVSNEKCLQCHTELKARTDIGKGYHSSVQVKGKQCITCHNDHHGREFKILKFNKETFDHSLTGYRLLGAHSKKQCTDCHKTAFITNPAVKKKKFTYLGLSMVCVNCHTDYHQKTLSQSCDNCHNNDAFKPASKFNHKSAKFQLTGKHQEVACEKCHKIGSRNGLKFQEFKGIPFSNCNSCHTDPHHNQFGQNCKDCHSVESFQAVKQMSNFDHSKTAFKLENKHQNLACKSCHKSKFTDPVKHEKCLDCHKDYHENQFAVQGIPSDCSKCHDTKGFVNTSFTIEQHNLANFVLQGAHLATPCLACHKKEVKWKFRNIGKRCGDCHKDIHEAYIDKKYYPESNCEICHSPVKWDRINVSFDHSNTKFQLTGAHLKAACRSCHFVKDKSGQVQQHFSDLRTNCNACHTDNHNRQFEVNGVTDCLRCHHNDSWLIPDFDHSKTAFKLDGKHAAVPCAKCHRTVTDQQISYVLYKIKDTRCSGCHSDNHNKQFEKKGTSDCQRCHNNDSWLIPTFDHTKTLFKLDGKHENVPCQKCHKTVTDQQITYVVYKLKDTRCESCHT